MSPFYFNILEYDFFAQQDVLITLTTIVMTTTCVNVNVDTYLIQHLKLNADVSNFYGWYNDLLHHYNISLSKFVCDLVLCRCVLHTQNLTSPDMTGYTLDSTVGAWPQQVNLTLFEHLEFPECSCRLEFTIYSRLCHDYGLMILD